MTKTVFISGASRGIGRAIALKLAAQKFNIIIAAKTAEPHPKLPGTIYTVAEEVKKAGGKAMAIRTDIRSEEAVHEAIQKGAETFGGIDILVNNASAINLVDTENVAMKRYDLMQDINVRGTFMVSKFCIPYLKKGNNPHILTLSPPLNLDPKWFGKHLAYTMSKYGMSMTVLGLAEELKDYGIAVNALWPKTAIDTAAIRNLLGGEKMVQMCRTTDIIADAAWAIFNRDSKECSGNFFIDEAVLKEEGITDFTHYAVNPEMPLAPDFFL